MSRTLFYSAITNEELTVLLDDMESNLLEEITLVENQAEDENSLSFSCSLDNLWDGLHFILTGCSCMDYIPVDELTIEEEKALESLNRNLLSLAIRGKHIISNEEEYMACILYDELPDIIKTLKEKGTKRLECSFHINVFKDVAIYSLKDVAGDNFIFSLLKEKLEELISFYEQTRQNNGNVLIAAL